MRGPTSRWRQSWSAAARNRLSLTSISKAPNLRRPRVERPIVSILELLSSGDCRRGCELGRGRRHSADLPHAHLAGPAFRDGKRHEYSDGVARVARWGLGLLAGTSPR